MSIRKNSLITLFTFLLLNMTAQQDLKYDALILGMENEHPLIRQADGVRAIGQSMHKAARGNYDPVISADVDNKYFKDINYYTQFSSLLKQPIFTGQYLKAGYEYSNGTYLNPENSVGAQGLPYAGIEMALLQGMMIDKRRAEVLKASAYKEYYGHESDLRKNEVFLAAGTSYFNWLFSQREIRLCNYFLELSAQRLRGIEEMANKGEKPAVDTVEAAIFWQSRYTELRNAGLDLVKSENSLRLYLTQELRGKEIFSADTLEMYYRKFRELVAARLLPVETNNPSLSKIRSYQKVLDVERRYRREIIKPVLNVNYNFLSTGQQPQSPVFSTNSYKWGATLQFPLLMRNSRNEFKIADLQSLNNRNEAVFKESEIEMKIRAVIRSMELVNEQVLMAERTADFSKKLVEAERLKFVNGESSLFMLNTRESKWLEYELKSAEYKLKYILSVLQLAWLKGTPVTRL